MSFIALLSGVVLASTPIPTRLTADVSDSLSLRSNPAGAAFSNGGEIRGLYGFQPQSAVNGGVERGLGRVHSGGLYLLAQEGMFSLAGGYDFSDVREGDSAETGLVGVALGRDRFGAGLAVEIRDDFGVGKAEGSVRAGLQWRPSDFLGFGFSVQDLGDALDEREWELGVALRPWTDRILFSTQWGIAEDVPLSDESLDLRFLGQIEPIDGVTLGFATDWDFEDFNGQLAIDIGRMGSEFAVFDQGDGAAFAAQVVTRRRPRPSIVRRATVLVADFAGDLVPGPTFSLFDGGFRYGADGGAQLFLDRLANSPYVSGALIRIGSLRVGWARAQELYQGIGRARAAGKKVACVLSSKDDRSYYVASACDQIAILPMSILVVNGIAAQSLYFGAGLDRLGVDFEVVRRGDYKTAPETLTRSDSSPPAREARSALLDEAYANLVTGIAEGRSKSEAEVRAWIDRGTSTATQALDEAWVDALIHDDELDDWVRKCFGGAGLVEADNYLEPERPRWTGPKRIAVVPIDATITGGQSRKLPFGLGGTSGADTLVPLLGRLAKDGRVAAVVLRVDSPGGEAVASERIARAVEKLAEVKPVAASFGDVAASGGYFVAAPTRRIFAEPTSITGSIGIFSVRASFARLLGRLGISAELEERGEYAGAGAAFVPLDPADRAPVERQIDFLYDRFLGVVARGRSMSKADVRKVAEGRVWSGRDALERNLVDELGGLDEAITWARAAAGMERRDVEVVVEPKARIPYPEGLRVLQSRVLERILSEMPGSARPLAAIAWLTAGTPTSVALPEAWWSLD
ncbi:MAG: signal peptide peptidase SppA [Myxococcota bacterium]